MSDVDESEPLLCCEERAVPSTASQERLWNGFSRPIRLLLVALIALSLALNIAALLPFAPSFEMHAMPQFLNEYIAMGDYNFGASIELLSKEKIYGIVALLIAWTCVFPPAKLFLFVLTMGLSTSARCRDISLGWLGHLGRFSLLDVYFVVFLVLVLTDQDHDILGIHVRFDVTVRWGLFLYHGAILLAMAAGEVIEQIDYGRQRALAAAAAPPTPPPVGCLPVLCGAPLWALAALVFSTARLALAVLCVTLPLFTVGNLAMEPPVVTDVLAMLNTSLFVHNTRALAPGMVAMASSGHVDMAVFAVDMVCFLVVTPVCGALLALGCILVPRGEAPRTALRVMHALSRFGNLEVLLAAVVIYLCEMRELILVRLEPGFYCLCAYVPALVGSLVCTTHAVRRSEQPGSRGGGGLPVKEL